MFLERHDRDTKVHGKYILGAIIVDTRYDLPAHRYTHTYYMIYK